MLSQRHKISSFTWFYISFYTLTSFHVFQMIVIILTFSERHDILQVIECYSLCNKIRLRNITFLEDILFLKCLLWQSKIHIKFYSNSACRRSVGFLNVTIQKFLSRHSLANVENRVIFSSPHVKLSFHCDKLLSLLIKCWQCYTKYRNYYTLK